MSAAICPLQKGRAAYRPKLPKALRAKQINIELGSPTQPTADRDQIQKLFPSTCGQPLATIVEGKGKLSEQALAVGVVLSGGQPRGGHNVIAGLFDALKAANPASRLFGFLKGPGGVIKGKYRELTAEMIDPYRNTGGVD